MRSALINQATTFKIIVNFSEKEVSDVRRKVFVIWWNVIGFYKSFAKQGSLELPEKAPEHPMDRWVLSRMQSLIAETTEYLDAYDLVRASRGLIEFVNELSTWYLRLSRDRIRDDETGETGQVFGYVLYTLAQLFAPFAPFFSELVQHNLVGEDSSIHLTDWPELNKGYLDVELEKDMALVQKLVEMGHAIRKDEGVKVRQPLTNATVFLAKNDFPEHVEELQEILMQELNVKSATFEEKEVSQPEVILDLNITEELQEEGEARELMRSIQNLRRKAGLKMGEEAQVQAPSWSAKWQGEIEAKTSTKLTKGDTLKLL